MKLPNKLPPQWGPMTMYQRFESLAALVMMVLVTLVIIVAIVRLAASVIGGLVVGVLNPLDPKVFQNVFGEIITVLIALEFNRTLEHVVSGTRAMMQTKIILMIALLAVARKFIVMEIDATPSGIMIGLAAICLVLGIVIWLLREQDERPRLVQTLPQQEKPAQEM